MKKLAFIDLEFHKKTKSSDFFKDILKEGYNVDIFYEEFPKLDYDVYLYWQAKPSYFDLIKLKNKTVIFCPMYDDLPMIKILWKRFLSLDLKIICFSHKLYDFFKGLWFDCLYIQYFVPPLNYEVDYSKKKCFFRYRGNITRDNIKTILWDQKVELTIKNKPDPWYKPLELSEEDIKKFNITFQNQFFDTKEEYFEHMAKYSIFIAPRLKEWIWMSFLESMGIWQCVIAYNESTMNEYIKDWENWLLTDFTNEVDISEYAEMWEKCKERYLKQYDYCVKNLCKVLDFISNKKFKTNFKMFDYISSLIIEGLLSVYRLLLKIFKF